MSACPLGTEFFVRIIRERCSQVIRTLSLIDENNHFVLILIPYEKSVQDNSGVISMKIADGGHYE